MRKLILGLTVVCSMMVMEVRAQSHFDNAIGFRGGSSLSAVTFKHFFNSEDAMELIAGAHNFNYGFGGSALYERHMGIDWGTDGFDWYFGGGVSLGYWDGWYKRNKNYPSEYYRDGEFYFGVSGIIGLEYTIPNVPLNFSVDFMPTVGYHVWSPGGALSIRYVIN